MYSRTYAMPSAMSDEPIQGMQNMQDVLSRAKKSQTVSRELVTYAQEECASIGAELVELRKNNRDQAGKTKTTSLKYLPNLLSSILASLPQTSTTRTTGQKIRASSDFVKNAQNEYDAIKKELLKLRPRQQLDSGVRVSETTIKGENKQNDANKKGSQSQYSSSVRKDDVVSETTRQAKENEARLNHRVAQLEQQVQLLTRDLNEAKSKNEEVQSMKNSVTSRKGSNRLSTTTSHDNAVVPNRLDESRQLKEENGILRQQLSEAMTRLSEEAKEKLVRGNPNIADLSDVNRPTKLAERLGEVYDNEWTDAFESLTQTSKKEEKVAISILLDILKVAYDMCQYVTDGQFQDILHIIRHPIYPKNKSSAKPQTSRTEKSKSTETDWPSVTALKASVVDCRKTFAAEPNTVTAIIQMFRDIEIPGLEKKGLKPKMVTNEVTKYIDKCVEITWLMCVQDPAPGFWLPEAGDKLDTNSMRAYTKSGAVIDFVVWPAVLLNKTETKQNILAKGIAQPK